MTDLILSGAVAILALILTINALILRFGWKRRVYKIDFVKHNALLSVLAPKSSTIKFSIEDGRRAVAQKSD